MQARTPHNAGSPRALPLAVLAALVVVAYVHSGAQLSALADSAGFENISDALSAFATPDFSASFTLRIAKLALESLLIGILGTAIATVIAIALAVAAADVPGLEADPAERRRTRALRGLVRSTARGVLATFRAIPEILWAFLFVRIFGLGPVPAVFAIAITFSGIIGKLFAELIEAIDPSHVRRLRASGASWFAALLYGVLPIVRRPWIAYALFRLECAIRSASVLGVVGAGGLGSEIDLSIRYFQYDKLATTLLAIIAYVLVLELVSHVLRKQRPLVSLVLLAGGLVAGSIAIGVPWGELTSHAALTQVRAFLAGFSSPNLSSEFLLDSAGLALTTVSMAVVATAGATALALVLAPMSTSKFTVGGYLESAPMGRSGARWLYLGILVPMRASLQVARALPEIVWALLFILWVGPGATAGILALLVHTVGILGRLYGDVFSEASPAPARSLEAAGASPLARYLYGVLPETRGRLIAFTLFRFEVNVRAAAMVGFVGAGGLGDAMHTAISLFHMSDLATLLLLTLCLVVAVDTIGDRIRATAASHSRESAERSPHSYPG